MSVVATDLKILRLIDSESLTALYITITESGEINASSDYPSGYNQNAG
jgi:hypothetical protein